VTRRLISALICAQAMGAITAGAQASSIVPSVGTRIVYDDNIFHRPAPESDLSVRFSPRLDGRRESERLALTGSLELDADRFARHPELTTARGGEAATIDARYAASRRWSIAGTAAFTETETPADLNELTALTPGRARARRLLIHPTAVYDLGALASVTVGYLLTADSLTGGVGVTTETASASVDRHLSARDALRVEYLEQHFLFDAAQANASRAFTGEWTRQVDRATTLTLRAGPRVTAGVLAPEITASARHALRAGRLSLDYQQTQTTLIGLMGIARTQSLSASVERPLGPRVTLHVTTGIVEARQGTLPSHLYRISGGGHWGFARALALDVSYDADRQHGDPYASEPAQIIGRHLVTVKLVVSDPTRSTAGRSSR
jgi:hypothetical protein